MMDTIKQQEEEIKQLKSRLEKSVEVFKEQQKTINELTNKLNTLKELVKKYDKVDNEDQKEITNKVEEQQNTSKNIFDPVKATFTI